MPLAQSRAEEGAGRTMNSDPDSIRAAYERHGCDAWYRKYGNEYRNPHEPIVALSLRNAVTRWKLDLSNVLDLAAGSGEVTLALREVGASQITGVDPFTYEAYLGRTGTPAERISFEQIAACAMAGRRFSLIVCSFGLHLCERSRLPGLCLQLAQLAPKLLILTPHKRPNIEPRWGWRLENEFLLQRVRTRLYHS